MSGNKPLHARSMNARPRTPSTLQTGLPKETVMEDHRNGSKITRTETQASGGSKEGVVRYVLIVGLALVVIAFVVVYIFA